MKLIAGLGNPGIEYAWTRHNAGWLVLDSLVAKLGLKEPKLKFRGAFWGPFLHEGEKICLLKPYTYMNLSGLSLLDAVKYYDVQTSDILVIYDDAALPFGKMRMREKGSAGGQKGMISIIGALGTLNIPRLRIGIGAPEGCIDMPDWVLGRIPKQQRIMWYKIEDAVWESLSLWLKEGIQKTMSFINGYDIGKETK